MKKLQRDGGSGVKILVLQLKRIGDLILTTPALRALRHALPRAHLTLAVAETCRELLPAIDGVDETLVIRRRSTNPGVWTRLAFQQFDVCLDLTGNDRSAFTVVLSKARHRAAFASVRKSRLRAIAYNRFVDSSVRDHHTVDHYLHLLRALEIEGAEEPLSLRVPADVQTRTSLLLNGGDQRLRQVSEHRNGVAVIHPGTARAEKNWVPERWAAVITHLRDRHAIDCVITGGHDAFERQHIAEIQRGLPTPCRDFSGQADLLTSAAIIEQARLCLSCDTAAVHFAAAFQRPQIALYGPTNPFHWRPRHPAAIVLSAGSPEEPMRDFSPRMKGAPMAAISTEAVIRATDALLAAEPL